MASRELSLSTVSTGIIPPLNWARSRALIRVVSSQSCRMKAVTWVR